MLMVKSQTRGWKSQPGKAIPIVSIGLDFYTSPIFVTPPQFFYASPIFLHIPNSYICPIFVTSAKILLHQCCQCWFWFVPPASFHWLIICACWPIIIIIGGQWRAHRQGHVPHTHSLALWLIERSKAKSQNIRAKSKNICWSYSHVLASFFTH